MNIEKVTKQITTVTLTGKQLEAFLLDHFGMEGGSVTIELNRYDDEIDRVHLKLMKMTTEEN